MGIHVKRGGAVSGPEIPCRHPAVGVQDGRIVGHVAEFDAGVADGAPSHGQELIDQVGPLRDVDATGRLDHGIPHLQGAQARRGVPGQHQPGVPAAVVVQRDEPSQVLLKLVSGQQRLLADQAPALGDVSALVSRDLLDTALQGLVPAFDLWVVGRFLASTEQQIDAEVTKQCIEVVADEDRSVVAVDGIGHHRRDGVFSLQGGELRCHVAPPGVDVDLGEVQLRRQAHPPPITDGGARNGQGERAAHVVDQQSGFQSIGAPGDHPQRQDHPGRHVDGGEDLHAARPSAQRVENQVVGAGGVDGDHLPGTHRRIVTRPGYLLQCPGPLRAGRGTLLALEGGQVFLRDPLRRHRIGTPVFPKAYADAAIEFAQRDGGSVPVEGVEDHGCDLAVRAVDQLPGHPVAQAAPVDQSAQAAGLPATHPVAHGAGIAASRIQITVAHPRWCLAVTAEELGHGQATPCFREPEAGAEGVSGFAGAGELGVPVAESGQDLLDDRQPISGDVADVLVEPIPQRSQRLGERDHVGVVDVAHRRQVNPGDRRGHTERVADLDSHRQHGDHHRHAAVGEYPCALGEHRAGVSHRCA